MSDETSVEYDLPVLLDGTVDSVLAKLADMPLATLTELRALEEGGKTRKSLLAAIDAQIAALTPETPPEPEQDTAQQANGGEPAAPSEGDAPQADPAGTFADAPMPEANPDVNDAFMAHLQARAASYDKLLSALAQAGKPVDQNTDVHALAAETIRELTAAVAENTVRALDGGSSGAAAPVMLALDPDAKADEAFTVVFGDRQGQRIASLGKLTFRAADFAANLADDSRLLTRAIDFPTEGPAADVASVWLTDTSGAAWSMCQLMAVLPVSGGRQASIPAGFLAFAPPVFSDVTAEAA